MKFILSLAFSLTHQRPPSDRPQKPPGRNWAKALERRYSVLQARRVRPLDWNRHEKKNTANNIILSEDGGHCVISNVTHYRQVSKVENNTIPLELPLQGNMQISTMFLKQSERGEAA